MPEMEVTELEDQIKVQSHPAASESQVAEMRNWAAKSVEPLDIATKLYQLASRIIHQKAIQWNLDAKILTTYEPNRSS